MRENSAKSGITADTFEHNGAICYNIDVPNIGPARAIAYDIAALNKAIEIAKGKQGPGTNLFMSWLVGLVPLFQG